MLKKFSKKIVILMLFFLGLLIINCSKKTGETEKGKNDNKLLSEVDFKSIELEDIIKDKAEPDGYMMCNSATILPYYNYKLGKANVKVTVYDSSIFAIFYDQITINSKEIIAGKTTYAELKKILNEAEIQTELGFGHFVNAADFQIFFSIDKYPSDKSLVSFIRQTKF